MTKNKKILLGVITLLPIILGIIYLIAFAIMFVGIGLSANSGGEPEPVFFLSSFAMIFITAIILSILTFGLLIYYIIHVANNKELVGNDRLIWILVIVFAHQIGYMIYWYLKIWKTDNKEDSPRKTLVNQ